MNLSKRYININDATMDAIRRAAENPFKQEAVRVGPDNWRVPMQEETYQRIKSAQLPGETMGDTILRVIEVTARWKH